MSSPLSFLRAGPPPPQVATLSDALFFTRSVAITSGATHAEAQAQVELALEACSPFPLAQLFYGAFWIPGADRALVYAAYRRRFTTEHIATWQGAELVVPSFATVLGLQADPATTVLLHAPECLTAVRWENSPVPAQVVTRALAPEIADDAREKIREELLRAVGGSKRVVEVEAPLAPDAAGSDRETVFRQGDVVSRIPATAIAALDVRDKGELTALRSARQRDVLLWRFTLGCAAAILLMLLGELALFGGRQWNGVREGVVKAQKVRVDNIVKVHELTNRIEELATKRLLPLEMVTHLVGENNDRIPPEIQFSRVMADQARGLYTVFVDGRTNNAAQVNAYEATLKALPIFERPPEVKFSQLSGERATFTLTATFKPEALKPAGSALVSSP